MGDYFSTHTGTEIDNAVDKVQQATPEAAPDTLVLRDANGLQWGQEFFTPGMESS